MRFGWSEAKRKSNLELHGFDFVDAPKVFDGPMKLLCPRDMSRRSSSRTSKTDWSRIRTMTDSDVAVTSEHPEASLKHIARGIARRGLKPVPPKASISLRVDADVLDWLKAQGPGYQTRINAILRAFKEASA